MVRAAGAVVVGLLLLAGGFALEGTAAVPTETAGQVLAVGGAVVVAIGLWQLVMRYWHSRED